MTVILVFVAFVVLGDAVAVGISSVVERFSEPASLLVFFALFISVFLAAWYAAVYVTERYLVRKPG